MAIDIQRREFIALLGGAAAWSLTARTQQRERMRRIGVLMNLPSDDAEGQARLAALDIDCHATLPWVMSMQWREDSTP